MDMKLFFSVCAAALMAAANVFSEASEDTEAPKGKKRPPADDEDEAPKGRKKTPPPADDDEDEAPKGRKKKPADDEDDEPAPKKPAGKKKPADDEDDGGYDYEKDIRPKITALSRDCGKEVALEVLEKFENPVDGEPCTKGSEVDPQDYERFLKEISKARKKHQADD